MVSMSLTSTFLAPSPLKWTSARHQVWRIATLRRIFCQLCHHARSLVTQQRHLTSTTGRTKHYYSGAWKNSLSRGNKLPPKLPRLPRSPTHLKPKTIVVPLRLETICYVIEVRSHPSSAQWSSRTTTSSVWRMSDAKSASLSASPRSHSSVCRSRLSPSRTPAWQSIPSRSWRSMSATIAILAKMHLAEP